LDNKGGYPTVHCSPCSPRQLFHFPLRTIDTLNFPFILTPQASPSFEMPSTKTDLEMQPQAREQMVVAPGGDQSSTSSSQQV
jgi:hypothetical protein